MVNGAGFGQTIRSINGSHRVQRRKPRPGAEPRHAYQQFVGILGVSAGANLYC